MNKKEFIKSISTAIDENPEDGMTTEICSKSELRVECDDGTIYSLKVTEVEEEEEDEEDEDEDDEEEDEDEDEDEDPEEGK